MHKGLALVVVATFGCQSQVPVELEAPPAAARAAPLPASMPPECVTFMAAAQLIPSSAAPASPPSCDDPEAQGKLVEVPDELALAIEGKGFFVLSTLDGLRFTRLGEFVVVADGTMRGLMGAGTLMVFRDKQLVPLRLRSVRRQPRATTTVSFTLQLDPNAPIITFNPAEPESTSNLSAGLTVFDSLGVGHVVALSVNRIASGMWDWRALTWGDALTGGIVGRPTEIASGSLSFDVHGRLHTVSQQSDFNPVNAQYPQALTFDFGDSLSAGGTGVEGTMQVAGRGRSEFVESSQDGVTSGVLERVSVDGSGRVLGSFSNGETVTLGRVALATFPNPRGLAPWLDGSWSQTTESGTARLGVPLEPSFGALRGHMREVPCRR
jgi:flagellar hook protein FlgE